MKGIKGVFHKQFLKKIDSAGMQLGYLIVLWLEGYRDALIHYCQTALFLNCKQYIIKVLGTSYLTLCLKLELRKLSLLEALCKIERLGSFYQRLLLKKYDDFAMRLGYLNWEIISDHTYRVYQSGEDGEWFATLLPNKEWAIWKCSDGKPPYRSEAFHTWQKAIHFLRTSFEQEGLPEWNWKPEGFCEGEDIFTKEPDREKKFYVSSVQ